MYQKIIKTAIVFWCFAPAISSAQDVGGEDFLWDGQELPTIPMGWDGYCTASHGLAFCQEEPTLVAFNPSRHQELLEIQFRVNTALTEAGHVSIHTTQEWEILSPGGSGSSADIALTKRDVLIREGWPPGALRIGLCRLSSAFADQGDLHAVLMVDSDQGTFVLGSRYNHVPAWHRAECDQWMMRSAGLDWVALADYQESRFAEQTIAPLPSSSEVSLPLRQETEDSMGAEGQEPTGSSREQTGERQQIFRYTDEYYQPYPFNLD